MDLQPVCEDDTVTVSSDSRLFFLPPQVLLQIVPLCSVTAQLGTVCSGADLTRGPHTSPL